MSKVLVAYFSASEGRITEKLAQRLASAAGGDLFEIVPETPYTAADIDYMNENSRSTIEMKDRSSRPAISSKIADIGAYGTIFVGFPVWWYREPSIIDTFMEQYDFSGKTVIPFATSGSTGIGDSAANMQALAPSASVKEGMRFAADAGEDELKKWAQPLIAQ